MADSNKDRQMSTLGRGEIQYAQWPTFNVRRGGVCRHRPLLPPPPCRRSCAELRGGFLGRGLAGCCRSSGSTQRTRRARTHGLHEHDDGHGALAGTLRWQRRLCCWTHAVRRRLSTHRAPSDDCACSCCGTEGWVSAAGIVWDWAGSKSGQAWRETRLSTMRRGAGLEWVDENVRRAAESSGRHIVEGSRTPAWSEDAAH